VFKKIGAPSPITLHPGQATFEKEVKVGIKIGKKFEHQLLTGTDKWLHNLVGFIKFQATHPIIGPRHP
jgi:hypothetical protein